MRMLILSYTIQKVITKFVINFKILGAVVPEISLTEKKVYTQTHTQTHKQTLLQKRQKLYTSYTLYAGNVIR